MADNTSAGLRILTADEDEATLKATDELLEGLGHTVTGHATNVRRAGDLIASEDPDLSIVVVEDDDEHALDLIEEIGEYARGPVIALVGGHEPGLRLERRRARDLRVRAAALPRRGRGRDRACDAPPQGDRRA